MPKTWCGRAGTETSWDGGVQGQESAGTGACRRAPNPLIGALRFNAHVHCKIGLGVNTSITWRDEISFLHILKTVRSKPIKMYVQNKAVHVFLFFSTYRVLIILKNPGYKKNTISAQKPILFS